MFRVLATLANWFLQLDMFDSNRAFTVQVPVLARRCPALLYAILALSARQMERKEAKQHSFDSLELYQEAIRLLNPLLQARDLTIIPICVILCCLEMMSASPQDWRRHLEGCAALFDAFGVNGFSGGLLQAVFWCYARMGSHFLIICLLPLILTISRPLWCSNLRRNTRHLGPSGQMAPPWRKSRFSSRHLPGPPLARHARQLRSLLMLQSHRARC
jgi:hypothetical protein